MRRTNKRRIEPGLPPGQFHGVRVGEPARIEIIDYSTEWVGSATSHAIEPAPESMNRWVKITGVPETPILEGIRDRFQVHELVLEDIVSSGTRIKVDDFDSHLFASFRALFANESGPVEEVEIDLLLFERTLITVEHTAGESFLTPIGDRLQRKDSLIRRRTVDVLFYAIVDLVVDLLFPAVESLETEIENLESELLQSQADAQLEQVQRSKTETQRVMSVAWSTRHAVTRLERSDHTYIGESARFYLRDVSDHMVQIIDTISDLKESSHNLMDLYRSGISNRINDVMKVLTIISTMFIPITFIAGIYGMNFAHMPELTVRWAYPAALGVMGVVVIGMLIFFKRRKWF